MDKYYQLHRAILLRRSELKGCGANSAGGGGFRTGNTCARGGPEGKDADKQLAKQKTIALKKLSKIANGRDEIPFAEFKTGLVPSQKVVETKRVKSLIESYPNWGKKRFGRLIQDPVVGYREKGNLNLSDGHHRYVAGKLLGVSVSISTDMWEV